MTNSQGNSHNSVFLVGMMGAGKSTFGKYLSGKSSYQFIDLDEELEKRCGVTIPEIFNKEGEEGFRARETTLLKEFASSNGYVIATGGGVVTREENRKILKESLSPVVFLQVSVRECYFRTKKSNRPLLRTSNPYKTIEELINKRTPLYEEVATYKFDTEKLTFPAIYSELIKLLER